MKQSAFILLLFSSLGSLAQINNTADSTYIGLKRNYLQTVLRNYRIIEYEKSHTGLDLNEGNVLYLFFDDEFCSKYYWLVEKQSEGAFRDILLKKGWVRKQENLFEKDTTLTCKISPINEGQNILFLVESKQLAAELALKEKESKKVALKEKPKPVQAANTKRIETEKKTEKPKPQPEYVEEPKYQGVKIWGWEVIKF